MEGNVYKTCTDKHQLQAFSYITIKERPTSPTYRHQSQKAEQAEMNDVLRNLGDVIRGENATNAVIDPVLIE
jgi:hypothetical protein